MKASTPNGQNLGQNFSYGDEYIFIDMSEYDEPDFGQVNVNENYISDDENSDSDLEDKEKDSEATLTYKKKQRQRRHQQKRRGSGGGHGHGRKQYNVSKNYEEKKEFIPDLKRIHAVSEQIQTLRQRPNAKKPLSMASYTVTYAGDPLEKYDNDYIELKPRWENKE